MKKALLLFTLFFSFTSLIHAQFTGPRRAQSTLLDQHNVDLNKVKGTPYEQKEFIAGKIIDEVTGEEKNCFIRFNAITDEVEVKDNLSDSKITSMLQSKGICVLSNNKEYRLTSFTTTKGELYNRISINLLKGKPYSIYKYIEKEFLPEKKATTTLEKDIPAKLKSKEEYFLEKDGVLMSIELHRKRLARALPSNQKVIEKYIKSNKLNVKKEADLIKVIQHYNSL